MTKKWSTAKKHTLRRRKQTIDGVFILKVEGEGEGTGPASGGGKKRMTTVGTMGGGGEGVRLESPAAGDGAIIEVVNGERSDVSWDAVEIRSECAGPLEATGARVKIDNFLWWEAPRRYAVAILGTDTLCPAVGTVDPGDGGAGRDLSGTQLLAGRADDRDETDG